MTDDAIADRSPEDRVRDKLAELITASLQGAGFSGELSLTYRIDTSLNPPYVHADVRIDGLDWRMVEALDRQGDED